MRVVIKIFGLAITVPILLISASFAVSNMGPVTLGLWPFQTEITLPTVLLLFVVLVLGFLLGIVTAYLSASRLRRRARQAEFRVRQLEIAAAQAKKEENEALKESRLPSLSEGKPVLAAE